MKDNTVYNVGKYNICGIKDPNLVIKMTKSSTWVLLYNKERIM